MNRIVLVNQTSNAFFPIGRNESIFEYYRSQTMANRLLRKIIFKLNLPFKRTILSKWVDDIKNADEIILFDTGNAPEIIKWIKKRTRARIVFWYWNPVRESVSIDRIRKTGIEIWSFDPDDCLRYGLKYNTQFFVDENINRIEDSNVDSVDVFYVGADKNRSSTIEKIRDVLDKEDISYFFNLVKHKKSIRSNRNTKYLKPLRYPQVLDCIRRSKAIVDLVPEEQSGLTLRPIESIVFRKKLITNMKAIKMYEFYNPKNVFILGEDNIYELADFIKSDYNSCTLTVDYKHYLFSSWLKRFDIE